MSIELVLAIGGIVLAIMLWLVTPASLRNLLQNTLTKQVDAEQILHLESSGLAIESKGLTFHEALLRKKRYVYWPVTPTDSPTIIHAVFLRYLRELSSAGLSITVVVFDNYYRIIEGKSAAAVSDDMRLFVSSLRRMGLKECEHKVVLESKLLENPRYSRRLLPKLMEYYGDVSKSNIDAIAALKSHVRDDTEFISYLKPIFNMLHLSLLSKDFGFTMSGYDEKILWESYHSLIGEARNYRLTNLYIPTMKSLTSEATSVWDRTGNINFSDSKMDVQRKVLLSLQNPQPDSGPFYILKYVYFATGKSLDVPTNRSGDVRRYQQVEDLITDILDDDRGFELHTLAAIMANHIYDIFHVNDKQP